MRRLFYFESKRQALLPAPQFFNRLLRSALAGLAILAFFLSAGLIGYRNICHYPSWVDSLLSASMILSGMGPIEPQPCPGCTNHDACKIFASAYALISGIVFITTIGIIIAPVAHRVFHKFHLEDDVPEAN